MAEIVLIMGTSGHGKSTSLRNFKDEEVTVINVANKRLPFQGDIKPLPINDYKGVCVEMSKGEKKIYVIDDSQYLMAFDSFNRAKDKGFDKFVEMAQSFYKLLMYCKEVLSDDTIVYFLHHVEVTEIATVKAKTIGKMIDNQLTLEGLFSIVLYALRDQDGYHFITQSDGRTTAKSPMGMFAPVIDNDLKAVDERIREYWGIGNVSA